MARKKKPEPLVDNESQEDLVELPAELVILRALSSVVTHCKISSEVFISSLAFGLGVCCSEANMSDDEFKELLVKIGRLFKESNTQKEAMGK